MLHLRITPCILNRYYDKEIYLLQLSYWASYDDSISKWRIVEWVCNLLQLFKRLVHAIDIHHKGMELVFIILKYHNVGIINIILIN